MSAQSIVLGDGTIVTGSIVEHLGAGRVIISYQGRHIAGEKLASWQRKQDRRAPK